MTTRTASGLILPTFPTRIIKTRSGKEKHVEYKIIAGSLKATNDERGIVEGYLNAIGNIDYGKDRSMPDAFKRTLDLSYKRKVANHDDFLWPYLWNHDTNLLPPGGIFDAEEDKKGLFIKAQLNLDYQLGRDMYSSYKFGSLKKQSMGYIAHQTEWVREGSDLIRNLLEVEILEGSGVIFPMNDEADITDVKSKQGRRSFYMTGKQEKQAQKQQQKEKKDFNDAYRPRQIADWKGELWSKLCALAEAIDDAWESGDEPLGDIQMALNGNDGSPGFIQQLEAWVQEGISLDYSNYMEEEDQSNGDDYYSMPAIYSYMSRQDRIAIKAEATTDDTKHTRRAIPHKAGAEFSQSNLQMLGEHIGDLHTLGDTIHQMAEDLAENTGAQTYTDPNGTPDDAKETDKNKANSRLDALGRTHSLQSTAVLEEEMSTALDRLGKLTVTPYHQT